MSNPTCQREGCDHDKRHHAVDLHGQRAECRLCNCTRYVPVPPSPETEPPHVHKCVHGLFCDELRHECACGATLELDSTEWTAPSPLPADPRMTEIESAIDALANAAVEVVDSPVNPDTYDVARSRVLALVKGLVEDAGRWRFIRQFLDEDGDYAGQDGTDGPHYQFVIAREEQLHGSTALAGWTHTVESLVDAARAARALQEDSTDE